MIYNSIMKAGYTYCTGKHKCVLCKDIFDCHGEEASHSKSNGTGKCHGEYEQFCGNHDIEEYEKYHKEHGEI